MNIQIEKYTLENDVDVKSINDGYEIFAHAVEEFNINPKDFNDAEWGPNGIIIVYHG